MTNETAPHENGVADPAAIAALAATAETPTTETAAAETPAEPKPPSFDDLGLHPDVKLALDEMGYFEPTPVQAAVYVPVSEGKDLMVQAKTGTGKTTAFGLPTISKIIPTHRAPQALILAPTRELALQVARELSQIAKHRGVVVETLYGGAPIGKQITALKNGVHIVVGTPGRVLDHIGRRTLDTRTIQTFILDECDEMLSMGFLEDIERVVSHLPEKKQTLLFSATMPDDVKRYSRRHMVAPETISLSRDSISVTDIHHAYYIVSGIARSRDLLKVILAENPSSAIIFCNMRGETTMIAKFLRKCGLDAEALSSDLSQADRERVMNRMKAKDLRFLCATDVAARGIDISDLSHVINYSVGESPEVYVHRTGRTGRAGKKGTALSLVGPRELGNFRYVRLQFGIKPEERRLPNDDIFEGKIAITLPPVGTPQPPDPVQILIRGVQGTATELETKIFEKLYATQNGKRVLARLVADKLDKLSTRTRPPRRDRPERTERPEGGDGEERRFDREERPRREGAERGDREERPRRFDRDGDRPRRFDREDRPRREGGERGDREDRGPRRAEGEDRGPRRAEGEDRGERGDRERRPWRDRGEGGDREPRRFDRDRGERRDRDAQPATETAPPVEASAETPSTEAVAEAPRGERDRDRGERHDRGDRREARDRGGRGRDRDRGGRDRDRGGRDRDRDRDRGERREATDSAAEAPAAVETAPESVTPETAAPEAAAEAAAEATKVDDVARAALDRADRGDKKARGGKKSEGTGESREFWETWAEEKTTRPEPEAKAEEAAADDGERKGRSRGGRTASRGRGKAAADKADKPARGKREAASDKADKPAAAPAADSAQARLFVSLGKKHGVSADDLRTLLAGPIGGDTARIGSVSLRDSHAHVRVPEELAEAIIGGVHGTQHNEHDVTVERARA